VRKLDWICRTDTLVTSGPPDWHAASRHRSPYDSGPGRRHEHGAAEGRVTGRKIRPRGYSIEVVVVHLNDKPQLAGFGARLWSNWKPLLRSSM
jgi:hypothetical protein